MSFSVDSVDKVTLTTDLQPVADLPSNGQLVTVRGRNWVVTDVQPSALPYDVTAASLGEGATFVSLSSVEDDVELTRFGGHPDLGHLARGRGPDGPFQQVQPGVPGAGRGAGESGWEASRSRRS